MIPPLETPNSGFDQSHQFLMAVDSELAPTNNELQLDLRASVILPELISQILDHKATYTAQCVTHNIITAVFNDWISSFNKSNSSYDDLERGRLERIAYDRISTEVELINNNIQRLLFAFGSPQDARNTHQVDKTLQSPETFELPSSDLYSEQSPWDSGIYSSAGFLDGSHTPATSISSSPPIHFSQPVYNSYTARLLCEQQNSTYTSPQLPYNDLPNRPVYTASMNQYAASIPFFSDFLEQWLAENQNNHSTEAAVVNFIDEHKNHIDKLFFALRHTADCALDKDKSSVRELKNFTQMDYYTAAVKLAYEIEKRIRLGPVKRNKSASVVGLSYDQRVQQLCEYLSRCKNSCLRLVKPLFITDVVDMPEKMLERFITNTAGNAVKSSKRKLANATNSKQESKNSKSRSQRVVESPTQAFSCRVSKRRSATKSQHNYADGEDDNDCEDNEHDMGYGSTVHTGHAAQILTVDPALIQGMTAQFPLFRRY